MEDPYHRAVAFTILQKLASDELFTFSKFQYAPPGGGFQNMEMRRYKEEYVKLNADESKEKESLETIIKLASSNTKIAHKFEVGSKMVALYSVPCVCITITIPLCIQHIDSRYLCFIKPVINVKTLD